MFVCFLFQWNKAAAQKQNFDLKKNMQSTKVWKQDILSYYVRYNFLGLSISECDIFASVLHLFGTYHPSLPHISSGWRGAISSRKTYTGVLPKPCLCASSCTWCTTSVLDVLVLLIYWTLPQGTQTLGFYVLKYCLFFFFKQLRKLVLEIIHRIPTNEHLRPHTKNILSVMFRFLEVWILFS